MQTHEAENAFDGTLHCALTPCERHPSQYCTYAGATGLTDREVRLCMGHPLCVRGSACSRPAALSNMPSHRRRILQSSTVPSPWPHGWHACCTMDVTSRFCMLRCGSRDGGYLASPCIRSCSLCTRLSDPARVFQGATACCKQHSLLKRCLRSVGCQAGPSLVAYGSSRMLLAATNVLFLWSSAHAFASGTVRPVHTVLTTSRGGRVAFGSW